MLIKVFSCVNDSMVVWFPINESVFQIQVRNDFYLNYIVNIKRNNQMFAEKPTRTKD